MTKRPLITTTATGMLSTLALLGCSAAATSSSPKAAPAAAHLTAYTTDDGPTESVIVTGAIGDYGQAVSVSPDGAVNPEHDSQLELRLSRGTFRLDIAAIDKAFVSTVGARFPTDAATCSGSLAVTQRVPIVAGSGTGAYKGAAGDFSLTITLDEVAKPAAGQRCDGTAAFLSQSIVTSGDGHVSF